MTALFAGVFGGASRPLVPHFLDARSFTSNQTTYDFGSFAAPKDGLLAITFGSVGSNNQTVAEVSIGGSAATIHVTNDSSNILRFAIASRPVLAGSHNISVTLSGGSGTSSATALGAWLLENNKFEVSADEDFSSGDSVTLDIPKGGIGLFSAFRGGADDPSWSTAELRYFIDTGNWPFTGAALLTKPALTDHIETVTWDGGTVGRTFAASFR